MSLKHNHEHAEMLLGKARNDQIAFEKLAADPSTPDDVTGFHAQQAVEKCLKAVLAANDVKYPFTQNLSRLLDLLREQAIEVPDSFEDFKHLTRFGAVFRYDDMELAAQPLDRPRTLERIRQAIAWAESSVDKSAP